MTSRAHGVHGSGSRDYSDADAQRVRLCLSATVYMTISQIAGVTGCEGRTVRAVLSALDGDVVLLAGGDEGYKLATSYDEAESMTRRLESQAHKMSERAARRRRMAATLPHDQGLLPLAEGSDADH